MKKGFIETEVYKELYALWNQIIRHDCNEQKISPQALLLSGGHGRGKTLMTASLLYECALCGLDCAAVHWPSFIDQYKNGIDGMRYFSRLMRHINQASVVGIDELGQEVQFGNSDHSRIASRTIVDMCFRQKYLIITTNLSKSELAEYLDSSAIDRLSSKSGYCKTIELPWESLRGKTDW